MELIHKKISTCIVHLSSSRVTICHTSKSTNYKVVAKRQGVEAVLKVVGENLQLLHKLKIIQKFVSNKMTDYVIEGVNNFKRPF